MLTKEEFRDNVLSNIKVFPDCWRYGQKVFNYIDAKFGVARNVQSNGIDCFYDDTLVEPFISACYDVYVMVEKHKPASNTMSIKK